MYVQNEVKETEMDQLLEITYPTGLPKRRMGSEALVYLWESADSKREDEKLKRELRKEELELKSKEHDER